MAKLNPGTRIYGTGTVDSTLFVNGVSAASSTATGALRVLGGVGVAAGVFVGGAVTATNIFGSSEVAVGSGNFVSLAGQGGTTRIRRDTGNNGLDLQTNSVSRLFIADAGNVGIGIVNPGSFELLTVGGSIRTTLDNSAIVSGNDGQLGFVKKSGFNATISSVIGVPIIFNRLNTSTAITSAAVVANTLTEYMRITPNGGISFGISGTAFGTAGQILQSNGNAPPTWVNTSSGGGSLIGGSSGQIPYMTGPNTTGFSGNLAWNSSTNILGVTGTVQASVFSRTGNVNSPLWTTTSPWFNVASNVLTDTTAAAGTTSSRVGISFLSPNFAATNAITVTDAVNLYVQAPVASTNVTITNNWGIYNQGGMYVNGNFGLGTTQYGTSKLSVNGSLTVNANDSFFGNFASGDYVDVGNLGATGSVYFDARGASTNVSVNYRSKGTGNHVWTYNGGSNESMRIDGTGMLRISGITNATSTSSGIFQVTGGVGVGSDIWAGGLITAAGFKSAGTTSVNAQGAWVGWNFSGGDGETNFVNQIGGGTVGGFNWSTATVANARTTLMWLRQDGALILNNGNTSYSGARLNVNGAGFFNGIVTATTMVISGTGGDITGATNITASGLITGGSFLATAITSATSTATGALQVRGGVGIGGSIYASQVIVAGAGGDITGANNITATGLITGGSFTGNSLGIGTAASGTTGEIRATNNITAFYSDRRLKENINVIDCAVIKVQSLHGITYTPNALAESFGYDRSVKIVGLFADEVEAVLPEAVKPAPFDVDSSGTSISGKHYKTIQYEKLVPLLVEAIKEQQLAIDLLKYELQELKNSNK